MLPTLNMNEIIETHDILLMTLDTLRFDVAHEQWEQGNTPNFGQHLPPEGWEKRHTPGSFTYAAHHAFFAGFLPRHLAPEPQPRLFAGQFEGSETTKSSTWVFDAPNMIEGFRQEGFHSICIGGVGFFNKKTPLGSTFPSLFDESHWSEETGVTCQASTKNQFDLAAERIGALPSTQKMFLFINISAMHQPNHFYLPKTSKKESVIPTDTLASHAAALRYVDQQLPILTTALRRKRPTFCIVCADHGTTYGEDGYTGHRLSHPVVWNVPYTEFVLAGPIK